MHWYNFAFDLRLQLTEGLVGAGSGVKVDGLIGLLVGHRHEGLVFCPWFLSDANL